LKNKNTEEMNLILYTKVILTVLAVGVLLNALNPWMVPALVYAETIYGLGGIESELDDIANAIESIASAIKYR